MIVLTTMNIISRIAIAVGLGTVLGLERTLAGKTAGMRTYGMISLGASVFVLVSELVMSSLTNPLAASPVMMPAAIISGIGFIGAGLIILHSNKITGLTTAAGLWVSAGVGMASGFGFTDLAVIATMAALIIFTIMWFLENLLKKYSYDPQTESLTVEEEKIREQENKFFNPNSKKEGVNKQKQVY